MKNDYYVLLEKYNLLLEENKNFKAFKNFNTSLTKRSNRNHYHTPARRC